MCIFQTHPEVVHHLHGGRHSAKSADKVPECAHQSTIHTERVSVSTHRKPARNSLNKAHDTRTNRERECVCVAARTSTHTLVGRAGRGAERGGGARVVTHSN